jgi:transcription termination/antitermination protein NusG
MPSLPPGVDPVFSHGIRVGHRICKTRMARTRLFSNAQKFHCNVTLLHCEDSRKLWRIRRSMIERAESPVFFDVGCPQSSEFDRWRSAALPILDREPSVWPEDLFEVRMQTCDPDPWLVCHVRPRTEKTVARRLRSLGIAYFLPQNERRKRYQRRLVRSHLPLFPGYIFVVANDSDPGRTIKEIVRSLIVNDQQQIERDLREIDRLLRSGQPITREERLRPGAMARIVSGPLAGLCGQVLKNRKGLRLVLQVHFLQQGASVEVDSAAIEAL